MSTHEQQEILIDYAEGMLSGDRLQEAEAMLDSSPELLPEVEILRSAFRELQSDDEGSVPEFYFTNFLPRLKEKLESSIGHSPWSLPRLLQNLYQPVTALLIISSFYGLYLSFNPEIAPSPVYVLIQEFEQNEIASIMEESSPLATNSMDGFIVSKLPDELLGIDPSSFQTENEMFALLEEQDAELVVDRIQRTVTQ